MGVELTVAIGPEDDDRVVTVSLSDDNGWSPDQMTDVFNRARVAAVSCWHDLHTDIAVDPPPG